MSAINFVWWNLQNFFDTDDDPIADDFDFTEAAGWTTQVFEAKKANLAQALNATHTGAGPELLAVAEIEKDSLLEALIVQMGNPHLKVVHDASGTSDLRGIDVAMAYDERKLTVKAATTHMVHLRYRTRDIFEVTFTINETGETLVVIAGHWPSRSQGKYESEPLRIAVAEHIAYLVEDHVKVTPEAYIALRSQNNLVALQEKWDAKVMVVGDFNDEPLDRSVSDHLHATGELDRVLGETNNIDGFKDKPADYRRQEVFLYNTTCKFLPHQNVGTYYFGASDVSRRYQLLDQLVVSRGLLASRGLRLSRRSVDIFQDPLVATPSNRPRAFSKSTKKGTSDHLPLTAILWY